MKEGQAPLKTSTEHQRRYRERLREQGLVKKDVWIRPEYAAELAAIEKSMRGQERDPATPVQTESGWSIGAIRHALTETSSVRDDLLTVETIEGTEPSLHLVLHEYGDLSLFVAAVGEQIIVEAYLWPVAMVTDPALFNLHVLRTQKLLPLSTIAVQAVAGVPSYIMFGALDAHSRLASLLFEIETLADNVLGATEAFAGYLLPAEPEG
jgi:uncharacterized protein YjfI (DUF2170 family)